MQYNQHLDKTLLIPVSEPRPIPKAYYDDQLSSASNVYGFQPEIAHRSISKNYQKATSLSSSFDLAFSEGNSKLHQTPLQTKRKYAREPGFFTVIKTGASGHNIR